MNKHTPGPWVAVSAPTMSNDSRWIFGEGRENAVAHVPWEGDQAERLANARLISAAPELLEALQGLVRYAEAARLSVGMGETQLKRLEAAKSAIAKAVPND